jgi:hypothetical protein
MALMKLPFVTDVVDETWRLGRVAWLDPIAEVCFTNVVFGTSTRLTCSEQGFRQSQRSLPSRMDSVQQQEHPERREE